MKLIKVYLVVARIGQKRHKGFIRELIAAILGEDVYNKYYGDFNLAVFSIRKEADKFMNNVDNLPFDFKPRDCHIQKWKVDYELNWREWEKEEKLIKKTK